MKRGTSKPIRGKAETPHCISRDRNGRWQATWVCLLALLAVFAPAVLGQNPAGNALHFDGSDFVRINQFSGFPTTAITVEFWMKTTDTTKVGSPVSYATPEVDNALLVYNYFDFQLFVNNQGTGPSGVSANDGQWHHIAISWQSSNGQAKFYKDGVLAFTKNNVATGHILPNAHRLVFGQGQVGSGFASSLAFIGDLDEIRIWNQVRSEREIQAHMNAQLGGGEASLVGYWHDGTPGTFQLLDQSGGHQDGVVSGATFVDSTAPIRKTYILKSLCDGLSFDTTLCDGLSTDMTLRNALALAAEQPANQDIIIDATRLNGTITLSKPLPLIERDITIYGPGAENLAISGNNLHRVFFVHRGNFRVSDVTIRDGRAKGGDGGPGAGGGAGMGGGIFVNDAHTKLNRVRLSNNRALGGNGASGEGGGGGGAGGNGGNSPGNGLGIYTGSGGGGGLYGNGGDGSPGGGGGGGGGVFGDGGKGGPQTHYDHISWNFYPPRDEKDLYGSGGGEGGGVADGHDAGNENGASGTDYGGNGGSAEGNRVGSPGGIYGGGGGGGFKLEINRSEDDETDSGAGGGGAGGVFGGGGGASDDEQYTVANGGAGSDFGGGGGAASGNGANFAGAGGFGGGGGGSRFGINGGTGGFGGGGGRGALGGAFGAASGNGAGGGGAALGASIFVRKGSLELIDSTVHDGTLTPGNGANAAGTAMFIYEGKHVINVSQGSRTISGTLANWSEQFTEITKTGAGTLVLSADNEYHGDTIVSEGLLRVTGDLSESSLRVSHEGALGGTGTVGDLDLSEYGTLSPGSSRGTLISGPAIFRATCNYNWDLHDAAGSAGENAFDHLQINGTLNLSQLQFLIINLSTFASDSAEDAGAALNFDPYQSYSWPIITATGGVLGFNAVKFQIVTAPANGAKGFSNPLFGGHFTVSLAGNSLMLNYVPITHRPTATPQSVSLLEDSAKTISLSGTDPDNNPLQYSIVTPPLHGSLSGTPPNVTYTPATDYNGSDSFTFRVQDGIASSDAEVGISVTGVNDPPLRTAGAVNNLTVLEDSGMTSLGLSGVTYSPGPDNESTQNLTYTVTGLPTVSFGEIYLGDGTTHVTLQSYTRTQLRNMRFLPAANANGSGIFTFEVRDGAGTANGGNNVLVQTVEITVTEVNDAPFRSSGTLNLSLQEDNPSGLGLGVTYSGGPADESWQNLSLTYTVLALPSATLGKVLLDGITPVEANRSYSQWDFERMTFEPARDAFGGPETFSFTVRDPAGTQNGGVDTLTESLAITVASVNDQPVRVAGSMSDRTVLEDSGVTSLGLTDLAYSPGPAQESEQTLTYKVTGVPFATHGEVRLADETTTVKTDTMYTIEEIRGMKFLPVANAFGDARYLVIEVRDNGEGPDGLSYDYLQIMITGVNDPPSRTAGNVNDLVVVRNSGATTLGLAGLTYTGKEAGQTLTYRITAVPSPDLGQVLLNDGITPVVVGASYTIAQIRGFKFKPAMNAVGGPELFSFEVKDSGGTANGGIDALSESLTITVTPPPVNDPPVRTAGAVNPVTVLEDAAAVPLGLGDLAYSSGPSDEAGQTLTYAVAAVPSSTTFGHVLLEDETTVVTPGNYSLAQIQGMKFGALPNRHGGPQMFRFTVVDNGGTANGGANTLTESLEISVIAVNDPPIRMAGELNDLSVPRNVPGVSLGLSGLSYSVGPNESGQTLTYSITALPSAGLGQIVLGDSVTPVTLGAYSLPQLHGLIFKPARYGPGGSETFSFRVTDNGGTEHGGVNTLAQSLTITAIQVNDPPILTRTRATVTVSEGAVAGNSGTFADPNGNESVTLTASVGSVVKDDLAGTWSWTFQTADGPAESQAVTITATDGFNAPMIVGFDLVVQNIVRAPILDEVSPDAVTGGSGDLEITLSGSHFEPNAIVRWNGAQRPTTFVNETTLRVQISAAELPIVSDLSVMLVVVENPGVGISRPRAFTITPEGVDCVQSEAAFFGEVIIAECIPGTPGQAGLTVAFANNTDRTPLATLSSASYSSPPDLANPIDTGGGVVDLQINGADPSDSAAAAFYYSTSVATSDEELLSLKYFTGSDWAPVLSSGGTPPVKDPTDNLDGTVSGGRFTATFDNTSTPKITELGGTLFAMSIDVPATGPNILCAACQPGLLVTTCGGVKVELLNLNGATLEIQDSVPGADPCALRIIVAGAGAATLRLSLNDGIGFDYILTQGVYSLGSGSIMTGVESGLALLSYTLKGVPHQISVASGGSVELHELLAPAGIVESVRIATGGLSGSVQIDGFSTTSGKEYLATGAALSTIASRRFDRVRSDYDLKVQISNCGPALNGIKALVRSSTVRTVVLENAASFGPIPSGAAALSVDTFTIRHDRTYPFDPSLLQFLFEIIP